MRVEFDEQPNSKPQRKQKRKKKGTHLVIFLLMIVLSAVIALCLTVCFNVAKFEISGNSAYSYQQIISASGVDIGDNLLRIDTQFAKSNIEKTLPYVASVKVVRKFPGTVRFEIKSATEYAYISQNAGVVIVDKDLKVLKEFAEPGSGIIHLKGLKLDNYTVGEKLQFSDVEQSDVLDELVASINELGLNSGEYGITMVDISDSFDLKFILNDTFYIKLGSLNNVDKKLIHLKTTLRSVDSTKSAEINLADWSDENTQAIFKFCNIDEYK